MFDNQKCFTNSFKSIQNSIAAVSNRLVWLFSETTNIFAVLHVMIIAINYCYHVTLGDFYQL